MQSYANNPAFAGFFKPTRYEADVYDCEVYGEIPKDLVGTLYRVQADPEYIGAAQGDYPMTGDGQVQMFRFVGGGHVDYKNRYVQTARLKANRKAYTGQFGVYRNPTTDKAKGVSASTASAQVVWHGGKLLALDDAGLPVELDPNTLATKATWTFGSTLPTKTFGARPKVDPKTGELIGYATEGKGDFSTDIAIYTVSKAGKLTKTTWLKAPYVGAVHDIAITPKYVIVPITGFTTSAERIKAGHPRWGWDAKLPTVVAVVPRAGGEVRWFKGPSRYAVRTINAVEDGNKVVLTLPVSNANPDPMYPNVDGSPVTGQGADTSIRRWTFDLGGSGDAIAEEVVFKGAGFARIDDRFTGQPARYVFKGAADASRPFNEAKGGNLKGRVTNLYQKVDLTTGQATGSYFVGDVQGLQEAVFVPRADGAAEGDGYLIGVVNNYGERKTDVVIVDANALEKGALATIKLPFRLRPGAHAIWAPVSQVPVAKFA
jgi:carotenoid cleavage dioxygenase